MDYREISKDEAAAALRAHAWPEHPTQWIARYPDDCEGRDEEPIAYGPFEDRAAAIEHAQTLTDERNEGITCELRPPGGHRLRIHSRLGAIGADHDLDAALRFVETAIACGWGDSVFLHDLLVTGADGHTYQYDVPRPERTGTGGAAVV